MSAAARQDLYTGIHKALRALMGEMVADAGRLDPDDAAEADDTLARLEEGLALCEKHLASEDRHLHPALDARCPGTSARAALEHAGHAGEFAALRRAMAALRSSRGPARHERARELYLGLARWAAENFLHMEHEERVHTPALQAAYTDEELRALLARLVGEIPPAMMGRFLRWMLPAQSHPERVAQLAGLRAGAPRGVYLDALAIARERLRSADWRRLADALPPDEAIAA